MLANDGFSITAYVSKETSGQIAVHSILWEANEYNVSKEDGVFLECVKKIQRTDNSALFVSALHPMSLSAQHASTIGGGNESSASEDVSPSNGPQIEVSTQVGIGQGVSTVSQTDWSLEVHSAVKDVNHRQEFALCGPVEESITSSETVLTFSGRNHMFTVLPEVFSIVYKRINWDSQHNIDNQVQFGIIDICSLEVYELFDGAYLIIIQTESGQTYLSGYLSTNATPIFATFQITSNLDDKRFKSFEHVSGTVFTCFFSDGTQKTFSIESGWYATINEVCHV
jgi:hypothetical protein